jgi:hypothetical protein
MKHLVISEVEGLPVCCNYLLIKLDKLDAVLVFILCTKNLIRTLSERALKIKLSIEIF